MAYDYQPVGIGLDQDDEERKYPYPPVAPAGDINPAVDLSRNPNYIPTAREAGASPMMAYPAVGTANLENRLSVPRESVQDATRPTAEAPKWSDYAPVEPHGVKGFMEGLGALISPGFGNYLEQRREKPAEDAYKNALAEYERPATEAKTAAETEQKRSQSNLENAQATGLLNPQDWKGQPGVVNEQGQPLELNEKTGQFRWGEVSGAKPIKTPAETAAQDKQAKEAIAEKAAKAGFALDDPKSFQKNLKAAQDAGAITPDEAAAMHGYQTLNATPATNLNVHVEGGQAAEDTKQKGKYYAYQGHIVRGDQLSSEERANAMPVQDPEKAQGAIADYQALGDSFNSYRGDIKQANLTPDDVRALQVLTDARPIAHSFLEKETAGALDSLFGEPLTGYSEKAMSGIMTKDQYDKLSPDGKKLLVDYFDSIISNFADMKHRLGSIGRNESMIQAEIHTIPLPYIPKDAADAAFQKKLHSVQIRNIYANAGAPAEQKTSSEEKKFEVPADAPAAPKQDGHKLKANGNVIAISKGGKWVAPQ